MDYFSLCNDISDVNGEPFRGCPKRFCSPVWQAVWLRNEGNYLEDCLDRVFLQCASGPKGWGRFTRRKD